MAKPMKTLELHYPMIQFLIKRHIRNRSTNQIAGNSLFSSEIILSIIIIIIIVNVIVIVRQDFWHAGLLSSILSLLLILLLLKEEYHERSFKFLCKKHPRITKVHPLINKISVKAYCKFNL